MDNKQSKVTEKMTSLKMKSSLLDSNAPVRKFVAPIIVSLFIILGLILAGLYYWYSISIKQMTLDQNPTRPTLETNKEPETRTATAQVESLTVMSTSDELSAVEADLLSTDLDSLDTEINQINAELEATN